MEVIAFTIGLDPILTRGQQLVDQLRTWKDNRENAPQLCKDFTSFETELAACIVRLQSEADKLPQQSREIIASDIASLNDYLTSARAALQSVNRRMGRNRAFQFFRANAVSKDCETLGAGLEDAGKLLREAVKHTDIRSAIEETKTGGGPIDRFRSSFPPQSTAVRAVLDFDRSDDDGNPITAEGWARHHLLDDASALPGVTAIHGIGGVGKSTIIKQLAVDKTIRNRFPDGVHFMQLGKDATVATLFEEIYRALKNSGAERTGESLRLKQDIKEALRQFEQWFDGRKCVFLVDDAWSHGIGTTMFSRLCGIGRKENSNSVLLKTREHEIALLAPDERIVRLNARAARGQQSREILFFHADLPKTYCVRDDVEDAMNEILDICAGLPVNLAVAGKNVRKLRIDMAGHKEVAWNHYRAELVMCRDKLLREVVNDYGSLYATFATSIAFLDEKSCEETVGFASTLSFGDMHRRLCVLRKQALVSANLLKRLWKTESDEHAKLIGRSFIEMGLANSELVKEGPEWVWRLRLHDSLHDYARVESDRRKETKHVHYDLLKSYRSCHPELSMSSKGTTKWWSAALEADGYIHRNVCRHLLGAGRGGELVSLLLTPEWTERQLEVSDILVLEADFSLGIEAVRREMIEGTSEERCEMEEALQLISEAARLSSCFVEGSGEALQFQMHGRLKGLGGRFRCIREYVDRIEEWSGPRLECLSSFLGEAGGANTGIVSVGSYVECMVVLEDGERVACGCGDGRIIIVNVVRTEIEEEWNADYSRLQAIAVGKEETRIVSGSLDGTAKVWEVGSGRCVTVFEGHTHGVAGVAIMEDGRRAVSVSRDGTAQVWHVDTGEVVALPFTGHNSPVYCVASLGDGDHVVTGGEDNKLRLWSVTSGAQVGVSFQGHEDWVKCVAVTPDGRHIVSGSYDRTLRVWDVGSHEQIGKSFEGHTASVSCVAVSGDGSRIVSGSTDRTIRIWDSSGHAICDPLKGHGWYVRGVSFLGSNDSVVSCSWDGAIRVWDVRGKNSERISLRHEDFVSCVCFTPDGKYVVSGSHDKTLRIWESSSGQEIGDALQGYSGIVCGVAVTADGRWIVSVSCDTTVRVWDLESRGLVYTLAGHTEDIYSVAVTPQGDRAVTGSEDQTVRVWDLTAMDGTHVVFEGHSAAVRSVFVTDDGLRVVSIDWEDNIFCWDLETRNIRKRVTQDNAWKLSRREVFGLVGETTVQDETKLSIPLESRQIFHGERPDAKLLAAMEHDVFAWALSPDQKTICVGLMDGQVCLMKLKA